MKTMSDFPWIYKKDGYTNVDVKQLSYPVILKDDYYKDAEGFKEMYWNQPPHVKHNICEEIVKGSRKCEADGCNRKFINSRIQKSGRPALCERCHAKANKDVDEITPKPKREDKTRAELARIANQIKYPFKFAGFTIINKDMLRDVCKRAKRKNWKLIVVSLNKIMAKQRGCL